MVDIGRGVRVLAFLPAVLAGRKGERPDKVGKWLSIRFHGHECVLSPAIPDLRRSNARVVDLLLICPWLFALVGCPRRPSRLHALLASQGEFLRNMVRKNSC